MLNNSNTYSGATLVSKGTLAGTGSVASSAVEITSGARVSPGVAGVANVANFRTGTLQMDNGSTYNWQFSSTTADVVRTARLTLPTGVGSTHSVTVKVDKTESVAYIPSITRTLFTFPSGTFTVASTNALYLDMTALSADNLQPPTLTVTADAVLISLVPEPTGVICLAALALLFRRR